MVAEVTRVKRAAFHDYGNPACGTHVPENYYYTYFKRGFDILISVVGLCLTAVVAVLVKLAFILTGDLGSIFYSQERVGRGGKAFKLYKFRSMCLNSEDLLDDLLKDSRYMAEWERCQKLDDDPRITPVGKILRVTSMDEMPQFLNVLKGDMSLIGPRPLMENELESHGGSPLYYTVRPGITGWWACCGRSNLDYDARLALEYYYIQNRSLWLDVVCFFKTIVCVIKKTGSR